MGQYYMAVCKFGDSEKEVYDTRIDGEFMSCKLMEHSWWLNPYTNAIASKFYKNPGKLAWVGDYAEGECNERKLEDLKDVWEESTKEKKDLRSNDFMLDGKYLASHTKKEYVDLDDYKKKSEMRNGWVISPVSILTALGNMEGGYSGANYDMAGRFAWNEIEIMDNAPEGYQNITDRCIFRDDISF